MRTIRVVFILTIGGICMSSTNVYAQAAPFAPTKTAREAAHVVNSFEFEIAAPMKDVAAMFGPEAERRWAGDTWDPVFLYPRPGRDVQGAVFTVRHGHIDTVWVNTVFDVEHGRMQYVAMYGNLLVTTVDVRVTSRTESRTSVRVTYARTALAPEANDHVQALGERDRQSGPEWQHGIEAALDLPK